MKSNWIYFDMDGVLAGLYDVPNWLTKLRAHDPSPYAEAAPMLNMSLLARLLNKCQKAGYQLGVISWTSKNGTLEYNKAVEVVKYRWLTSHLPSIVWDAVYVVPYGTNKKEVCGEGILFDDEERNRVQWGEGAHSNTEIIEVLKELLKDEHN